MGVTKSLVLQVVSGESVSFNIQYPIFFGCLISNLFGFLDPMDLDTKTAKSSSWTLEFNSLASQAAKDIKFVPRLRPPEG